MNIRGLAAKVVAQVMSGRSLTEVLAEYATIHHDYALLQAMSYGVVRYYEQLDWLAKQLLHKPFKKKDQDVYLLLLLGLYQLQYMRIPDYAAISETVAAAAQLKKSWAKHSINACLRQFTRRKETLMQELSHVSEAFYVHPHWLIMKIKNAWPSDWESILNHNNQQAPLCLRINQQRISAQDYLKKLEAAQIAAQRVKGLETALILNTPKEVKALPGYYEGEFSVQDGASQFVATLLAPQKDERILDACAAPGGKSCHLLEIEPSISLVALDKETSRLDRMHENLKRLQLNAQTAVCDAEDVNTWWDGKLFDAILLDAPCSATGVIRRHPDIKLLRRSEDIPNLVKTQASLLEALWPLLKKGGRLLYSTCSIFTEENVKQMGNFLSAHNDASEIGISLPVGHKQKHGWQILPGEENLDGFYYCLITKN